MNYCFFSTGSWAGNGSMMRLRDLGAAMIDRGVQVSYLLDSEEFNQRQLELHPRADRLFVPKGNSLQEAKARRRMIKELNPDYLHVLSPSTTAFVTLAGLNVKIVGDWDEWPAIRKLPLHRRMLAKFLDRWLRRRSDVIVLASKYMVEQFGARYGLDSLYLPHASFLPEHADGVSPFSQPTLVYVGNFWHVYDHDVLLHAALILKQQRNLTPRIEMVAGGLDLQVWVDWVKTHGLDNVTFPGFLRGEELWRHMRHARALLFPMRMSEVNLCRCPGKVFIYAHARRPIITTNVGEIPNALGNLATYVDCTPEAFADAMAAAIAPADLPDVDFPRPTWGHRAATLIDALQKRSGQA